MTTVLEVIRDMVLTVLLGLGIFFFVSGVVTGLGAVFVWVLGR